MSIKRLSDSSIKEKNVGGAGPRMDGRWAVIRGGTVTTLVNTDGTIDAVHTFAVDGTLIVDSPGYAEVLVVGGGGTWAVDATPGPGGEVNSGLLALPSGAHAVTIGAGSQTTAGGYNNAQPSTIGTLIKARGPRRSHVDATPQGTRTSSITGTSLIYGPPGDPTRPGGGQNVDGPGANGIVIVRVRESP